MHRSNANYTLIAWKWFILTLCCVLLQSVGADEPTETSHDPVIDQNAKPDDRRVVKIDYYNDTEPVSENIAQLNILRTQTAVRIGNRFSRYAIQQSVKALYTTQQYSQIQVYSQDTPDGVVLTYQLTPFARIKEIALSGIPENEFKNAIENVMKSKPGGRYVPAIVKTDIDRIKRICREYGYFDAEVTVADALTEDGTLTYQIIARDASTIKRFQIQGNTAISTNRLKAACNFSRLLPIYNKSNVDTDVASMLELYRKSSYPTATIVPTFVPETGILQFRISEGKHVQLNFVLDVGKLPLSRRDAFREDITPLINTASSSMWERRIKSYFKDEGYHDTTVQEKVVDETSVQLTINPGKRYVVKGVIFSGNRAFSDADLLREMTTKPTGGFLQTLRASITKLFQRKQKRFFYEQDLEDDMHRLKFLYGRAGYPKAAIEATPDKQNSNDRNIGEVVVYVRVAEEHKAIIHRCAVSGNHAIDTATLLERLQKALPFPQPNASFGRTTYQNAVLKAYYELGYRDVRIDATYIGIEETKAPVFEVAGDFSESLADGTLPLEIRGEFEKHNLTLAGVFIATIVGNRWSIQDSEGNPRYTLKQESTHLEVFEHGVLQLDVVTEGEQIAFGKFYFVGDTDVVKQHVLEREVAHLEGTLWTSEKLSRALQSLYNLGIFRRVQSKPFNIGQTEGNNNAGAEEEENPSSTLKTDDVLIEVEKQKPRTHSESFGYSFAEGTRVTLELTDSNFLFKRNIRGRARWRLGWRDELGYLFDATLTEPWLIGRTRGSLQVLAKKLEVDDNVRALQGSFILSRDLSESHRLDLRYSYRDLNQPLPPMQDTPFVGAGLPRPYEGQNPFSTTVSGVRFSWTYDTRVRYLNPTGGMLNALTLEYAGGFLQGETSFIKTTTDTRYYRKLVGGLVLASALRLGVTTGLHSSRSAELISFERFWAGGGTTVRGYAERSLGPEDSAGIHRGDVQFIFNTELRFPIYWLIRGALFFDTGNVWGSLEDIDIMAQLPSSVGAGLYLDLGALTAGVDYAIPLVSVPGVLDPNRAFHIRLGSTF